VSDAALAEVLEEVRRIDVLYGRLLTDMMAGAYTSVFRGSGVEFDRVREYAEGDDPRTVDWNVTARVGRPFVRTYVDERELTMLFLLDLSPSMDTGSGAWSARQTAARVCACLALAASRNGDKVGLVAFGSGVERFVPPKRGAGHALRIIRDCLALPPSRGRTDLAPALRFAARVVRRRAAVFVVSDFLADGWSDALSLCARRHDVIAVRILAPELEPSAAGRFDPGGALVRVRDPETGGEALADWASPRARDVYRDRVARWRAATDGALRRAKVDRMDVPVPRTADRNAIARPVLRFFRMREVRGEKR
jgi:uncharacterized protein (DUF58 family)